jgi:predicted NUDIX family NTP pyrophosphohydrolase
MKISAGLLLYKYINNEARPENLLVLLVHPGGPYNSTRDLGAWSIPKGLVEETIDSDLLHAAIRETQEELGINFSDIDPTQFKYLGTVKQLNAKTVHAWAHHCPTLPTAFIPKSNTTSIQWPPKSGKYMEIPEVDKAEFFDIQTAKEKINPAQRPFIDRLET